VRGLDCYVQPYCCLCVCALLACLLLATRRVGQYELYPLQCMYMHRRLKIRARQNRGAERIIRDSTNSKCLSPSRLSSTCQPHGEAKGRTRNRTTRSNQIPSNISLPNSHGGTSPTRLRARQQCAAPPNFILSLTANFFIQLGWSMRKPYNEHVPPSYIFSQRLVL
jgi:hypothetical protein